MKQYQRCRRKARHLVSLRPTNRLITRYLRIQPHTISKDDQALLNELISHFETIEPLFISENAAWQVT